MKMNKRSHMKIGLLNGLFYILFIAVLGMLGYLGQKHQYQADWTFGSRNTLSETTQQILESIKKPLNFVAYVPDDNSMHEQIRSRLDKYKKFKSDITVEMVNPDLDPARATADGVQYQGQVVVKLGERKEIIESLAEKDLANLLQRISRGDDRLVVFLEGHEEREPYAENSAGMSKLAQVLKSRGFRLQPHNLVRTQSLPVNTSFLVIASPQKELLLGEVDIIRDYVKKGGNLLWLIEPGPLMGLEPLEEDLGLLVNDGTLVDANEQLRDLLGIKHPAVIPVVDYNDSEISRDIDTQTLFPFATAIERDEQFETDWHYEDFLLSLATSWLEVDELQGNVSYEADTGDKPGPLSLGVAMDRTFKKDGATDKNQRVVVVGDSDFMLNAFVGHVGNMDLSMSLFNWLAADDQLVNIKVISAPDTRLELEPVWLYSLGLFFLIILPLVLVLIGVLIWYRRRKR